MARKVLEAEDVFVHSFASLCADSRRMSAKDTTMCAKGATMSAEDATMCAKETRARHDHVLEGRDHERDGRDQAVASTQ